MPQVDDVESKPLLAPHSSSQARYGTISVGEPLYYFFPRFTDKFFSPSGSVDSDGVSVGSAEHEDGRCWVCLGNDNPSDLFYPCNCQLHRKCIKQWVAKVSKQKGKGSCGALALYRLPIKVPSTMRVGGGWGGEVAKSQAQNMF